ncbi:MAG TPA: glycosyltransferase family 2 protein [Patescibacteria group bacterium]|nr:glycosyltransferase family 2 protein [Patescibacteria group bacterium]
MNSGISAVVITKNEEKNIARCLGSLRWCDEIIVIDDNSTDKTVDTAKRNGATVYIHDSRSDFSQQRNFGLGKANGNWILFVDSDEIVSLSLQYEITNLISDQFNPFDGFLIKRIDEMWGKKLQYGETGNIFLLRLAKKNAGKWAGKVHETWEVKGKIGKLQNSLLHFPHPKVADFLQKVNYYSSLRAMELYEKKVKVSAWQIVFYPKAKFIYNYFFKLGFLDGARGLIVALMMSFHSFLVRSKLWVLNNHE